MKAIVSAASGRSVSSSTTSASGVSRGAAARGRVVGQRLGRLAEGDDPPPRARSPPPASRRGRGGSVSAPALGEDVGRAEHVGGAAAAAVERDRRSTSTPRRTAPRRCTRLGLRRGTARRSSPGSGCGRRRWRRSAPSAAAPASGSTPSANSTPASRSSPSVSVPVLSTQIVSTAARLSVALICWTSVSRCASRTAATAKVTLISSTRPSGISVTRPAVAVCAASSRPTLRTLRLRTAGSPPAAASRRWRRGSPG